MTAARHLANGLARSGLPRLAWRVRRVRRHAGRALVLMYHRVSETDDYVLCCVPPAVFDSQMKLLRQRAHVLPLRALVERLRHPEPLSNDIAAITFDDGYRDNLEVALPILQRYDLPATVFITTGFIDGSTRPVHERLRAAFELLWTQGVRPVDWCGDADGVNHLVRAALKRPGMLPPLGEIDARLKMEPWAVTDRLLNDLELRAGGPTPAKGDCAEMLDWDAVRALVRNGVEVASHTASHVILSRLPLDQAEQELRVSKQRIEAEIGRPVLGFAFPNGHHGDFTDEHVALLQRSGYAYACTAQWGGNVPGCDAFRLRRIGVGRDSKALLDLKLALARPVQPCAA